MYFLQGNGIGARVRKNLHIVFELALGGRLSGVVGVGVAVRHGRRGVIGPVGVVVLEDDASVVRGGRALLCRLGSSGRRLLRARSRVHDRGWGGLGLVDDNGLRRRRRRRGGRRRGRRLRSRSRRGRRGGKLVCSGAVHGCSLALGDIYGSPLGDDLGLIRTLLDGRRHRQQSAGSGEEH